MKKLFLTSLVLFASVVVFGQSQKEYNPSPDSNVNFRLYKTPNMWTFIKLDTRDGRMWQVQYTVGDDVNEFETTLNSTPLAISSEKKPGKFALYPTENNWTFLLLDQESGTVYHVQWSQEPNKRGVWLIN